jgi:putative two-component system response regulator
MKQHAVIGYELLKGSASRVLQVGAEIALGHHEKFDGSGYPNGISGEDIPIFSRIVAVADVFDALTSERPYKKAWEVEAAVDFLNDGAGSHFDPQCVKAFLNAWDDIVAVRARFNENSV